MKGNQQKYQAILLFNPKAEDGREKVIQKIEKWLGEHEAKVSKKEDNGVKELVYTIKDNKKAAFWTLEIESVKPLKLSDLNIILNREIDVIRYLILKV